MYRFPADLSSEEARWHLGIGDPNTLAWVFVALYVVAAVLAFLAVIAARDSSLGLRSTDAQEADKQRSLQRFWLLICVVMVGIGINKQLDLQSLLIQIVRDRALREDWYSDRGRYKSELIGLAAVLGLAVAGALLFAFRCVLRRVLLGMVGMALLALFVAIRAAGLDDHNDLIDAGATTRPSTVLEFVGIGVIIVAAVRCRRAELSTTPPVAIDDVVTSASQRPA